MNAKSMKTFVFMITGALILSGCASLGGGPPGVDVLASGNHSNIEDQQYTAIHKQAVFDALWQKAFANLPSTPDKPVVDFSKKMVIAAFIGKQGHGGYLIRVTKIDSSGATTDVSVEITIPGANCRYTQAPTEPFLFVSAPATSKSVNFNFNQRHAPACG